MDANKILPVLAMPYTRRWQFEAGVTLSDNVLGQDAESPRIRIYRHPTDKTLAIEVFGGRDYEEDMAIVEITASQAMNLGFSLIQIARYAECHCDEIKTEQNGGE